MSPEKENTFRALKDEPLLVTSFICWFGIHKWTKYDEPFAAGTKYRPSAIPGGYYEVMIQVRSCANCNQVDHRKFYIFKSD
jgi:hypothetical protein